MDKSIRLTKGQLEVYNYVLDPNSEGRVIVLKGIAGSGKSFTVSQIVKDYKGSILATATTHKAKNNLQTSIGIKAYTTHSALGFNMVRNGIEQYLSDVREPLQADLLIIDEMSMLPNKVYQKALNGSYKRILLAL